MLLSVTVLVCPSRWSTGWTRAAQDPYRQNWLWHSRHWRSALPYSVCFFHLLPFDAVWLFFLSLFLLLALILISVIHLFPFHSLNIDSHFSVHSVSVSGLLLMTDNSWLLHLLNVFLVAAKLLYIQRYSIHTDTACFGHVMSSQFVPLAL